MIRNLLFIFCLFMFLFPGRMQIIKSEARQANASITLKKNTANKKKTTLQKKISNEKVLQRFLSYIRIESQSLDDPDFNAFPMTKGQKKIATFIANEIKSFKGDNMIVTLSNDYYIYVKIPSNLPVNQKNTVPSLFFTAHLDVSPEAPGKGITPLVHRDYQGNDIKLPSGTILSPSTPAGAHLNNLKGKTIITSDGTTLLGADDKSGCTILVTMIEELTNNPQFLHPDIYVMLSQNEDIGRAAYRYDPSIFGIVPDIVIDVDGDSPLSFSAENFTAIGQTFYFKGNKAHPSHGLENQLADALTASAYFIGSIPPHVHPSTSSGKQGYVHCYACEHPLDSLGKPIEEDYIAKYRIRYFSKTEGDSLNQYLTDAYEKTCAAYPFVTVTKSEAVKQYDNVAYSMYKDTHEIIRKAASKEGINLEPQSERGGTTSAMLVTTGALPGGPCIYSGQQAEHSCLEWSCLEDMTMMIQVVENIIAETLNYKK